MHGLRNLAYLSSAASRCWNTYLTDSIVSNAIMRGHLPATRKSMKGRQQAWRTFFATVLMFAVVYFIYCTAFPWAFRHMNLHRWNYVDLPKTLSARKFKSTLEGVNCNPLNRLGIACCGHRGAPLSFPENTIPSFLEGFRQGATCVEMDVLLTQDSQFAVGHSRTLNQLLKNSQHGRKYSNTTLVDNMSLMELKQMDLRPLRPESEFLDIEVPSLGEVFEAVWQMSVQLVLELKLDGGNESRDRRRVYGDALINFLEDLLGTRSSDPPAFHIVFISFDRPLIDRLGGLITAASPSLLATIRGYGYVIHPNKAHTRVTFGEETSVVGIHHSRVVETKNLWNQKKYTLSWVTDDLPLMEDQVRQGVNGVITNDPSLCKAMCQASTSN